MALDIVKNINMFTIGGNPNGTLSFARSTEKLKVRALVFEDSFFKLVYDCIDQYVDAEQIFNPFNKVLVKLDDTKSAGTFGGNRNSSILITALLCLYRRFKKEASEEQRVKQIGCLN